MPRVRHLSRLTCDVAIMFALDKIAENNAPKCADKINFIHQNHVVKLIFHGAYDEFLRPAKET